MTVETMGERLLSVHEDEGISSSVYVKRVKEKENSSRISEMHVSEIQNVRQSEIEAQR